MNLNYVKQEKINLLVRIVLDIYGIVIIPFLPISRILICSHYPFLTST